MKARLPLFPTLVFAFASVSLTAAPAASCQASQSEFERQAAAELRQMRSNPGAMGAALRRHRLVEELLSRFHISCGNVFGGAFTDPIFPAGRADRAYVWIDAPMPGTGGEYVQLLDCYQMRNGRLRRTWRISLDSVPQPVSKGPVHSLAELLKRFGFVPLGRLTRDVRHELDMRQDLVEYYWQAPIDRLVVEWLACPEQAFNHGPPCNDSYDLDEDPITGATLANGQFYAKYGLPVSHYEFPLFHSAANGLAPVSRPIHGHLPVTSAL